jgi:hypothetical protein
MIYRRLKHLPIPLLALLASCTNTIVPNTIRTSACTATNLPGGVIYAKLQESAPQGLIIRNGTLMPVRLVAQRPHRDVFLDPSSSIQISFRVLSIEGLKKPAGQFYYVRTSVGVANRFEEIDRLGLAYGSSSTADIRYRDPDGREHVVAFDLSRCGANSGWEHSHWTEADHYVQLPFPTAGVPQALCPLANQEGGM